MKLKQSLKDSLCYSESIYIDFELSKPIFLELWGPLNGIREQDWEAHVKIITTTNINARCTLFLYLIAL